MNPIKYLMEEKGFSLLEIDSFLGKARETFDSRPMGEAVAFIRIMNCLLYQKNEVYKGIVIGEEVFPPKKTVGAKKAAALSEYFRGGDLEKVLRIKGAEKIILAPRGKELLAAIVAKM